MADTATRLDTIAEDYVNVIEKDRDLKCECCIQYKTELTRVTSELKSALKIIDILREEQKIDDSSMDEEVTNRCNHEEGIDTYSPSKNENWTEVTTHLHKRDPSSPSTSPLTVLRTSNRFDVLHNLDNELMKKTNTTNTTKKKSLESYAKTPVFDIPVLVNGCVPSKLSSEVSTSTMSAVNSSDSELEKQTMNKNASLVQIPLNKNTKHTILLIGDSHIRDCADKTKDNLNKMFSVLGLIKPGADINILSSSIELMVKSLTHNDVIVLSGGTKDIGKNNSKEAIRNVLNFVKTNSHTNIVLLTVPHRYDLESWSCVNEEIRVYNRKLEKCIKCFKHVTLLNHDLNRALYTRHGLHFNKTGKNVLARNIALICSKILHRDKKLIYLPWKENNNNSGNEIHNLSGINNHSCKNYSREASKSQTSEPLRKSSRLKQSLLHRRDDFLW
jgi:lysophospholipase L1-like esterase